jgi:Methyltransferase domain
MNQPDSLPACRLCNAATIPLFRKSVLGKFDAAYLECTGCGSLQTEEPYWLADAYADDASLDPGAVQRCLHNLGLTLAVSRTLGLRRLLDYGGGYGLLCRLLRDAGVDAYSFDRYRKTGYAAGFDAAPTEPFDLVTAFEVLEHLANPGVEIDEIFLARPRAVLASTEIYRGQGSDWWYLAPIEGQHVFFYSAKAIQLIGARYGYDVLFGRGFILYSRNPLSAWHRFILTRLVRESAIRMFMAAALVRRNRAVQNDFEMLTSRMAQRRDH